MTSHQLAAKLLEQENLPVVINGWGSDGGNTYAVDTAERALLSFEDNSEPFERDDLGYTIVRPCIILSYDEP